ncbi:hypothetical protein [Microbacterium elymi]|uniref:Uncharacterized protein n=1 Tax=Microbacterium elymi TaxID=2909587 RepID=A0ABY5NLS6_9MICO|nr:hypothetical protein [Microbacterium elymi]UUT36100.1 hypothetical protein L2X98_23805 [Microbacterium elymi]
MIAFWSDAAILLPLGAPVSPTALLDDILRLPARGLTNVAFPLELAATQARTGAGARCAGGAAVGLRTQRRTGPTPSRRASPAPGCAAGCQW